MPFSRWKEARARNFKAEYKLKRLITAEAKALVATDSLRCSLTAFLNLHQAKEADILSSPLRLGSVSPLILSDYNL